MSNSYIERHLIVNILYLHASCNCSFLYFCVCVCVYSKMCKSKLWQEVCDLWTILLKVHCYCGFQFFSLVLLLQFKYAKEDACVRYCKGEVKISNGEGDC